MPAWARLGPAGGRDEGRREAVRAWSRYARFIIYGAMRLARVGGAGLTRTGELVCMAFLEAGLAARGLIRAAAGASCMVAVRGRRAWGWRGGVPRGKYREADKRR